MARGTLSSVLFLFYVFAQLVDSYQSNFVFAPTVEQVGSVANDDAEAVAWDKDGNIFLVGSTDGSLFASSYGSSDIILAKYSANNTLLAAVQYGTSAKDSGNAIVISSDGDVLYVCGMWGYSGSSPGLFFIEQFETQNLTSPWAAPTVYEVPTNTSVCMGLALDPTDPTAIFAVGFTAVPLFFGRPSHGGYDIIVIKADLSQRAAIDWVRMLGTTQDDYGRGIWVDQIGMLYVVGILSEDFGIFQLRDNGQLARNMSFGGPFRDEATSLVLTTNHLFVCGTTEGNFTSSGDSIPPTGTASVVSIAVMDIELTNGSVAWMTLLSPEPYRGVQVVATSTSISSSQSYLYITGATNANSLLGVANQGPAGTYDAVMAVLDMQGSVQYVNLLGPQEASDEFGQSIVADSAGNAIICGSTNGTWGDSNAGLQDVFSVVNQVAVYPTPSTSPTPSITPSASVVPASSPPSITYHDLLVDFILSFGSVGLVILVAFTLTCCYRPKCVDNVSNKVSEKIKGNASLGEIVFGLGSTFVMVPAVLVNLLNYGLLEVGIRTTDQALVEGGFVYVAGCVFFWWALATKKPITRPPTDENELPARRIKQNVVEMETDVETSKRGKSKPKDEENPSARLLNNTNKGLEYSTQVAESDPPAKPSFKSLHQPDPDDEPEPKLEEEPKNDEPPTMNEIPPPAQTETKKLLKERIGLAAVTALLLVLRLTGFVSTVAPLSSRASEIVSVCAGLAGFVTFMLFYILLEMYCCKLIYKDNHVHFGMDWLVFGLTLVSNTALSVLMSLRLVSDYAISLGALFPLIFLVTIILRSIYRNSYLKANSSRTSQDSRLFGWATFVKFVINLSTFLRVVGNLIQLYSLPPQAAVRDSTGEIGVFVSVGLLVCGEVIGVIVPACFLVLADINAIRSPSLVKTMSLLLTLAVLVLSGGYVLEQYESLDSDSYKRNASVLVARLAAFYSLPFAVSVLVAVNSSILQVIYRLISPHLMPETSLKMHFHKGAAWNFAIAALVHTIAHCYNYANIDAPVFTLHGSAFVPFITGIIMISMLILTIGFAVKAWILCHMAASSLLYFAFCFHGIQQYLGYPVGDRTILITIVFVILSRWLFWFIYPPIAIDVNENVELTVTGDQTKIVIEVNNTPELLAMFSGTLPGAFVQMAVRWHSEFHQYTVFHWHPFTVAQIPTKQQKLRLFIQLRGHWTQELKKVLEERGRDAGQRRICLQGPYHGPGSSFAKQFTSNENSGSSLVILWATGVGCSLTFSLLRYLHENKDKLPSQCHIVFKFYDGTKVGRAFQPTPFFKYIQQRVEEELGVKPLRDLKAFDTQANQQQFSTLSFSDSQRFDKQAQVHKSMVEGYDKCWMVFCGSEKGLGRVSEMMSNSGVNWELFAETF